jgi:hypothetical protein
MEELVTNAPASWPKVRLKGFIPSNRPEHRKANQLHFATAVEASFRGSDVQVLEADVIRITPGGAVQVPLRVRDKDGDYDLFFYGDPDPEAAGHYEALQALARKTGRFRPIFYSTDDLTLVYPDPPAEPVARRDRLYVSASLFPNKGQYAMWWADKPGERFLLSRTYEIYDRIYHEVAGLETSAFAQILLELEMIQDEEEFALMTSVPNRIEIPLLGPEGVPMVASFSPDRGIRFHLHMRHANAEYRDAFLELFLARIKLWKKESPATRFTIADSLPLNWWRSLWKRLQGNEEEQTAEIVGSLNR